LERSDMINKLARPLLILLGGAATALLTACATPSGETINLALATPGADEAEIMTGSRIPRKSTDRLLRRTDAAGARDMERSRPPESGPKFN
jgi:hypothetical protein